MDLSSIAWHPKYPTQLVISSQNDNYPVAQLWDLKYSTQPIQVCLFIYLFLLVSILGVQF